MSHIKKIEINNMNFENNKVKIKDELVYLINTLNSVIKSYYRVTKEIILFSKENIKNKSYLEIINHLENQLYLFIGKAKDIFNKMKYTKKKRLISQEKDINKLNNYFNNNFFYYSNAQNYESNNNNNNNKISDESHFTKINYKSPEANSNFNINYINYNNYMNKYNIESKNSRCLPNKKKKIINLNNNSKINYSVNMINNHNILPKKLDLGKITNKEEVLKKILFLLKQLKNFKGKIFYETNNAQNYKNIFNCILEEINNLIELLSKEKNKEYKCLSERNYNNSKKYKNALKNTIQKNLSETRNKNRDYNYNININKTFNIVNKRNFADIYKIKQSKSQNIKLKEFDNSENREKDKKEKNILNKCTIKEKEIKLINKEQQTDNLNDNLISKQIQFFIDNKKINEKIIEKEKIIKDLENKNQLLKGHITSLKDDLSNSNNQLSFFKTEHEKQNKVINDNSREIDLLKKIIDLKNKEESLIKGKKEKKSKSMIKEEKNININQYEEIETDRDKIIIKYELLKLDYDKQKNDLKEKEKIINNYNVFTNNSNDTKNIDEQIYQLIKKHKNEIDKLTEEYTKNIINLKVNLPNCFSPNTHEILIDKKFKKYNLHWYLLTIISAKNKDYENTYWVSENEIKDTLDQFNKFKNEDDLEKENALDYFNIQKKLIEKIEINENKISKLENELKKYQNIDEKENEEI